MWDSAFFFRQPFVLVKGAFDVGKALSQSKIWGFFRPQKRNKTKLRKSPNQIGEKSPKKKLWLAGSQLQVFSGDPFGLSPIFFHSELYWVTGFNRVCFSGAPFN